MSKGLMRSWNVHVHRGGFSFDLGQVQETSEALARCAALHKYGLHPGDEGGEQPRMGIAEDDEFDVSPA